MRGTIRPFEGRASPYGGFPFDSDIYPRYDYVSRTSVNDESENQMSSALRYKKKPVVIEAIQIDFHDNEKVAEIMKWSGDIVRFFNYDPSTNHFYAAKINTIEGEMSAQQGDWIIQGVNGEFYPCKPDIFDKTYEVVDD